MDPEIERFVGLIASIVGIGAACIAVLRYLVKRPATQIQIPPIRNDPSIKWMLTICTKFAMVVTGFFLGALLAAYLVLIVVTFFFEPADPRVPSIVDSIRDFFYLGLILGGYPGIRWIKAD